jgi:ketopantoate reductase
MAKDFTDQRPVELEGLTGTVVRMARELEIPTPANDLLYAILKPAAVRIEALNKAGA